MSKKRQTHSLEPEVFDFLKQPHINASALVNDLVKRYMNGEASDTQLQEFRLKRLKDELDNLETQVDEKREKINQLEKSLSDEKEKREQSFENKIDEAMDALEHVPLNASNDAVQNWADKCGLTEQELIDEIKSRREE